MVILYLSGGLLLWAFQEKMLFQSTPFPLTHRIAYTGAYTELNLHREGNRNLSFVKFHPVGTRKGIILYFHGNRENVERYAKYMPAFVQRGYEVWMPDYPGFGKSTGRLTEQRLYNDAAEIYRLARLEAPADGISIWGKSLGSGIAAQLASTIDARQLILETPYYSLPAIARDRFPFYPTDRLIRYKLASYQYLPKVTEPTVLLHGTADAVISYAQAQKLAAENPDKRLLTFPAGEHNNLSTYPRYDSLLTALFP